jgi:hypothetical protein
MILCPDAENHLRSPEIVPLNRRRSAPLVLSVSPSTTHRPFFTVSASGSLGSRVSPEIDLSRRKSASALLDAGNGASGRPLVLTHGRGSGFIGSHPGSLPLDLCFWVTRVSGLTGNRLVSQEISLCSAGRRRQPAVDPPVMGLPVGHWY